jgi:hypothetical protein
MQRTVADYKVLLKEYDLDVDFIEDYGKVKKVYTKTGVFALKEMANHQERNQNFIQKLQNVYQKGWILSLFIKRSVLSPLFQMKAARIT